MDSIEIEKVEEQSAHINTRCECHNCMQIRWNLYLIAEADKPELPMTTALEKMARLGDERPRTRDTKPVQIDRNLIRKEMEERDWTQTRLAQESGVSQKHKENQ